MKLIVAGGRDFNDYALLCSALDNLRATVYRASPLVIVSGMARGADMLGVRYARENRLEVIAQPANWDAYGKSAGHRRNAEMGAFADVLLAFWDGRSTGTAGMIRYMEVVQRKPIHVVRYNP